MSPDPFTYRRFRNPQPTSNVRNRMPFDKELESCRSFFLRANDSASVRRIRPLTLRTLESLFVAPHHKAGFPMNCDLLAIRAFPLNFIAHLAKQPPFAKSGSTQSGCHIQSGQVHASAHCKHLLLAEASLFHRFTQSSCVACGHEAAFVRPPTFVDAAGGRRPSQQGSAGRHAVRGFGATQLDFALRRQFNLTERVKLRFPAELFNAFNHPNFGPINSRCSIYVENARRIHVQS